MDPREALGVMLVLLAASTPIFIIGVVAVVRKEFEHKQIMAAIQKGIPLSELRPLRQRQNGAAWIRKITAGIAAIVIGLAFILVGVHGVPNLFVGLCSMWYRHCPCGSRRVATKIRAANTTVSQKRRGKIAQSRDSIWRTGQ